MINDLKMKSKCVLLVMMVALSLQSCLVRDMRAPQAVFEAFDVTVPADSMSSYGTGNGTVSAIVPVRSSQSWSAIVMDAENSNWLEIAVPDFVNPVQADVTTEMKLICDNNADSLSRSATIRFTLSGGEIRDIKVTQEARKNRIKIDGETSATFDAEVEAVMKVKLLCNTDWTAEVDTISSTCGVTSISPVQGNGDAVVTIKPASNYDCTRSVVAVVRFCVSHGDTAVVTVNRNADVPFIGVNTVDETVYRMPGDTSGVLRFNCNMPWKAEILENTIKNFKLEASEGKGGMNTEIPFTMSANDGQETLMAKVKLTLASDSQKYLVLTVVHRVGFMLNIDFSQISGAESCPLQPADTASPQIPFSSSSGLNSKDSQYNYKFLYNGKEFIFGIKNSMINVFGNGSDGYIRLSQGYVKFPAVEGYKLAYVEFTTAATNKTYVITADAEGTVIVGAQKTAGKEVKVSWELNTTGYNKSYYEYITTSMTRQHNLKLLYVK